MPALTKSEKQDLEAAKAFLNTAGKYTALSKSKVLDKHAETNPGVRMIAENWSKKNKIKFNKNLFRK